MIHTYICCWSEGCFSLWLWKLFKQSGLVSTRQS